MRKLSFIDTIFYFLIIIEEPCSIFSIYLITLCMYRATDWWPVCYTLNLNRKAVVKIDEGCLTAIPDTIKTVFYIESCRFRVRQLTLTWICEPFLCFKFCLQKQEMVAPDSAYWLSCVFMSLHGNAKWCALCFGFTLSHGHTKKIILLRVTIAWTCICALYLFRVSTIFS